jgi:hypothetical protein
VSHVTLWALHVTPDLDTLAFRWLAHEVTGRDAQSRSELTHRIHARLTAGLEAGHSGSMDAGLLGELQLDKPALHAPVQQRRGRGQSGARHPALDGSRVRRQSDSVAILSEVPIEQFTLRICRNNAANV